MGWIYGFVILTIIIYTINSSVRRYFFGFDFDECIPQYFNVLLLLVFYSFVKKNKIKLINVSIKLHAKSPLSQLTDVIRLDTKIWLKLWVAVKDANYLMDNIKKKVTLNEPASEEPLRWARTSENSRYFDAISAARFLSIFWLFFRSDFFFFTVYLIISSITMYNCVHFFNFNCVQETECKIKYTSQSKWIYFSMKFC